MTNILIKKEKFRHRYRYTGKTWCGKGGKNWSNVSTVKIHQGLWATTRSEVEAEKDPLLVPTGIVLPCWHFNFGVLTSRTMKEYYSVV